MCMKGRLIFPLFWVQKGFLDELLRVHVRCLRCVNNFCSQKSFFTDNFQLPDFLWSWLMTSALGIKSFVCKNFGAFCSYVHFLSFPRANSFNIKTNAAWTLIFCSKAVIQWEILQLTIRLMALVVVLSEKSKNFHWRPLYNIKSFKSMEVIP